MISSSTLRHSTIALSLMLSTAAGSAMASVELPSSAPATLGWAEASGPVAGYTVFVSIDGGGESVYGSVNANFIDLLFDPSTVPWHGVSRAKRWSCCATRMGRCPSTRAR